MARKRVVISDDDYSQASSDEYEAESSKAPATRARTSNSRAKRAPRRTAKAKTKRAKLDVEDSEADEVLLGVQGPPHAASMHVVTDPEPVREALLEWYGKVHESRGMPWRKPYNPDLSAEERAQRAYEVELL